MCTIGEALPGDQQDGPPDPGAGAVPPRSLPAAQGHHHARQHDCQRLSERAAHLGRRCCAGARGRQGHAGRQVSASLAT